jgi:hypothetical protein
VIAAGYAIQAIHQASWCEMILDGDENEKIPQYGFMERLVHLRHSGGAYVFNAEAVATEKGETAGGQAVSGAGFSQPSTGNRRNRASGCRKSDAGANGQL